MNLSSPATPAAAATATPAGGIAAALMALIRQLERIPHGFIALLGRFSIAATFWLSGQTKVDGFAVNFITGEFKFGWPRLSDNAIALFKDEYKLPLLPPELAAPLAATAEHVFPLLILFGLATRLSALALLGMTLVIEIFVYPDAYAVHGTWATVLLYLIARGPGPLSIDHLIAKRYRP